MLTREEYDLVRALRQQGWSISAIARHLARDRKTVRSYVEGERVAGLRSPAHDAFSRFLPYCRQRLADDPHLPASTLFDEVAALGYPGRYSTFTRALRNHQVRPACEFCRSTGSGEGSTALRTADETVLFEWLELPDLPAGPDGEGPARLLLGSLARLDRWRAVITEGEQLPQVVEAVDQVLRRLNGSAARWRFGRVPALWCPKTGRVVPAFAEVAKYYGATVGDRRSDPDSAADPARHATVRRWWRTVPQGGSLWGAQESLDRFASAMDGRRRPAPEVVLMDLPATPYPLRSCVDRTVTSQGLVPFRGNLYAVPPDLSGASVRVCRRLGEPFLSITTASGAVIARHELAPQGAGLRLVDRGRAIVLDRPTRPARDDASPCRRRSAHRPLSQAAQAEANALKVER